MLVCKLVIRKNEQRTERRQTHEFQDTPVSTVTQNKQRETNRVRSQTHMTVIRKRN